MNHEPDKFEKGVRFGCGSIFGFVLGLYLFLNLFVFENSIIAIIAVFTIVFICGFLAMKKGDRFWYSIKSWWF
jgi:hypothetical protein